ncbi:MFS transporter [Streptomyces sp. NBC_00257]|uniref:MFS transporter n=1 Tax=unclassified Streptomyces TaxID=2593676 RepID=UPI00225BE161|nr:MULTISPECIES: MFS transporter [unclassified Streptomyces]MCX4398746.1 MFS transporter [Streptomyces sp. NBC_01767]MCX4870937.1 MFS transporter [Streptomyces sp. NBC_00906]MCX4901677.1 MFS transporter [Streptomyces sp. NBC_00892]MCX5426920.1 MFS transporter [Streptomyces sp. NBC_00062]WSP51038.1 MFS transporter [Streptomyces sp. NBC_01243]
MAAGLLTDSYTVLIGSRFLCGLAYAGFFAVSTVTAISLVTPDRTARASGVVVSGLSLAMTAGGPAGALVSHFTGWRGGFWVVVVLTILGALSVLFALPATSKSTSAEPSMRRELSTVRRPQLWIVYAITILSTAAYMISFNYLAAFLTDVTGIPEVWVPAILALFGVGASIGLSIGGRIADSRPSQALMTGAVGILVCSVLLALLAPYALAVVPLVLLLGVAGFVLNPAIYGRFSPSHGTRRHSPEPPPPPRSSSASASSPPWPGPPSAPVPVSPRPSGSGPAWPWLLCRPSFSTGRWHIAA